MKFSTNTDFTKLPRATAVVQAAESTAHEPLGTVVLEHDERHLRRRVLRLPDGDQVLVDLHEAVLLADGDLLLLEDGRTLSIAAAKEELLEVRPGAVPLRHLAWHLGNRHLAAQIDEDRILIPRDAVIGAMLKGLGASVTEVIEPFQPVHGAYHNTGHGHAGGHGHEQGETHGHGHEAGARDKHGRLPGDPHYGHNHA